MWFSSFTVLTILTTSVHAHFQLLYPPPRGPFVENIEPNFCGGYPNAVSNRSTYPLTGGVFSLLSEHTDFTVGVLLSTVQNPNSFDNFSSNGVQQFARDYAKEADAGTFCIPLDIAAANIPGAVDGANVTIQIVYAADDGNLYQCADLTLSSNFTTPSNFTCKGNVTDSATSTSAAQPTSTGTKSSGTGQIQGWSLGIACALGLVGLSAIVM